jgi:very-short-patch-repair endonuclease
MNAIEQKFFDAMLVACRQYMHDQNYEDGMDVMDYLCTVHPGEVAYIETFDYQRPVGIYIVDFIIESVQDNKYVIEIDGQETHKTKEQRYRDYKRERFLQEEGMTVFRFTASEVYVNALSCARWVLNTIEKLEDKLDGKIATAYCRGMESNKVS